MKNPARLALVLVGGFCAMIAVGLVAAGAVSLWADTAKTDADGYFTSEPQALETATHALVSDELAIDGSAGWPLDRGIVRFRLATSTPAGGEPVFVGIAPRPAIDAYLAGVAYDEVTNVELDPPRIETELRPGSAVPEAPSMQPFWVASVEGSSAQTLDWDPEPGSWAVVVMNADGSAGVATQAAFGAELPFLFELGLGLTLGGAALLAGGVALLVLGLRRPPRTPAAAAGASDQEPLSAT